MYTTPGTPMRAHAVALAPIPGLSNKTTLTVAWAAPFDNGDPITSYNVSVDGVWRPVSSSGAREATGDRLS